MSNELISRDPRIPPIRGIVAAQNAAGKPYGALHVQRWLRLTRLVHKTDKVDVAAYGPHAAIFFDLLETARELDLRLSLRTDASYPPDRLDEMKTAGLHDVFLTPEPGKGEYLDRWMHACRDLGIPLRLMVLPPFREDFGGDDWVQQLQDCGATAVYLALSDPFLPGASASASSDDIRKMEVAAAKLESESIEANLVNIPHCLLDETSLARSVNRAQADHDHSFYIAASYDFATVFFRKGTVLASKIILILLSNYTLAKQPMDNFLLPAMVRNYYTHITMRLWRRLTGHLRFARGSAESVDRSHDTESIAFTQRPGAEEIEAACGTCHLRRICDGPTAAFKSRMPATKIAPREGDLVVSPLHFSAQQPKVYDDVDRIYLDKESVYEELTEEAVHVLSSVPADRHIGPHDYEVEGTHFDRMESGLKWWSLSNKEILSSPLGTFDLPLTISADFGAGIADFIGFSLGRHCKLLCPMEGYRHTLTLHVNEEGRYVLLRDKRPVRPAEFKGHHFLPLRLGDRLMPRISAWNIDDCIATTNVAVWTGKHEAEPTPATVKYSIIIVSTRFTRRLQAVLNNLAHQKGIDFNALEVIVTYVPGLDATDDLLDSMRYAHPHLRIIRSPFPEQYMKAKGFMINESFKLTGGEWIMLLDSDTLLPPNYFAKLEEVSDTAEFVAPDGRRLLNKDITHKILMGEIAPWVSWDELIKSEGEFRFRETMGIPVGFCQCFRRKHLVNNPYQELDHFESADMYFGMHVLQDIGVGNETRLSGTPVIHLDHGGSQWYGTQRHM